jgi:hypothetical protein
MKKGRADMSPPDQQQRPNRIERSHTPRTNDERVSHIQRQRHHTGNINNRRADRNPSTPTPSTASRRVANNNASTDKTTADATNGTTQPDTPN